jgi:hypothetical protein
LVQNMGGERFYFNERKGMVGEWNFLIIYMFCSKEREKGREEILITNVFGSIRDMIKSNYFFIFTILWQFHNFKIIYFINKILKKVSLTQH